MEEQPKRAQKSDRKEQLDGSEGRNSQTAFPGVRTKSLFATVEGKKQVKTAENLISKETADKPLEPHRNS